MTELTTGKYRNALNKNVFIENQLQKISDDLLMSNTDNKGKFKKIDAQ